MVDVVDNLIELLVQFAADDLARVVWAIGAIEADLRGEHGRRARRADAILLHDAGLRVQSRRNVD